MPGQCCPDHRMALLDERVLGLHADCAEFCPNSSGNNLLAAGTYELNEQTQHRAGRLYLYGVQQVSMMPC